MLLRCSLSSSEVSLDIKYGVEDCGILSVYPCPLFLGVGAIALLTKYDEVGNTPPWNDI